jgi:hypothetical protein
LPAFLGMAHAQAHGASARLIITATTGAKGLTIPSAAHGLVGWLSNWGGYQPRPSDTKFFVGCCARATTGHATPPQIKGDELTAPYVLSQPRMKEIPSCASPQSWPPMSQLGHFCQIESLFRSTLGSCSRTIDASSPYGRRGTLLPITPLLGTNPPRSDRGLLTEVKRTAMLRRGNACN